MKLTEDDYHGLQVGRDDALYKSIVTAPRDRTAPTAGRAQRLLATDAVAGFLFQPQLISISNKG